MAYSIIIAFIFFWTSLGWAGGLPEPDYLLVKKAERQLYLIKAGKPYRKYKIALGHNPVGHKQRQGDYRTPEGIYFLDWRKNSCKFYKSIHISYPNDKDLRAARERGDEPGGMIMLHGLPTHYNWDGTGIREVDWTTGCIGLSNQEIDEIWSCVKDGTLIEIIP
jgi:murein L,D-transpeptidase YafK